MSCVDFYRLQKRAADQAGIFRKNLRSLAMAIGRRANFGHAEQVTVLRIDKYMGKGSSRNYNRLSLVHNVVANAESQLRNGIALATFDRNLGAGGTTEAGKMVFGNKLSSTTILHEAIHFGTAPWRSTGGVPLILDRGNIGSYQTYGTLRSSLERARYGWDHTSKSAASYAWLVTGP